MTQTAGKVTVTYKKVTPTDVNGLTEALGKKQDTVVFTGEYTGDEGGKAVSEDTLTEKLAAIKIPEYTIAKAEEAGEFLSKYELQKDGAKVGEVTIDIPKDMVVQSGEVVTVSEEQKSTEGFPEEAGTYIKLVLQNVEEPLWIDVGNLIEYVTAGTDPDGILTITVSDDHKVGVTIQNGKITGTKLAGKTVATGNIADGAVTST